MRYTTAQNQTVIAFAAAITGLSVFLLVALAPWHAVPARLPTVECGAYTAAGGERVKRPCGDWRDGGQMPSGATARCGDGTWSYSRRPDSPGTCSGHGGIVRDG